MEEDEKSAADREASGEDIASWAVLETLGTEQEAMLVVGFLRSNGLAAEMESLVFHQEPVNFGGLGEARVRVPVELADEARRLLDERLAAAEREGAGAADIGRDVSGVVDEEPLAESGSDADLDSDDEGPLAS